MYLYRRRHVAPGLMDHMYGRILTARADETVEKPRRRFVALLGNLPGRKRMSSGVASRASISCAITSVGTNAKSTPMV